MKASNQAAREAEIFAKFLEGRKVVIADGNAAARSSLFNLLKEMGAKSNQLFLANTYEAAEQRIRETQPHIVIAEYDLGQSCGLELLRNQREQRPKETKECIFILVTGNTSQSSAARALEEDIDAYIIKPYTLEFVRSTIIKAAMSKIKPSKYFATIDKGKDAMAAGNLDEAESLFVAATTLDSAPALAYYYIGQVKFLRTIMPMAQSNYMKGLKLNQIHYKCLVGMYELLMKEQRHSEAYDIVRKLAKYFPANPKRLSEVLRLAIINKQYEDIEGYYKTFTNIDQRNPDLSRAAAASMVICGKYYLSSGRGEGKAMDIFNKAAATASTDMKIMMEIIGTLLEYGLEKEAQKFLQKFPPEMRRRNEFLVSEVLVLDRSTSLSMSIDRGRELLARGIKDPKLYLMMIKRSKEAGLQAAVEDLVRQACTAFPDKKEQFEKAATEPAPPKKSS